MFVVKGAMLIMAWTPKTHRPTRDLDFLGTGEMSDERLKVLIEEICATEVEPDGVRFDTSSLVVEAIRGAQEYQGKRVRFKGFVGKAGIGMQVDVGVGDAVTPKVETLDFPSLLGLPTPRVRACPKESVVAEKLEAMVDLGLDNSRMKDFFDLWTLSGTFAFKGPSLCAAIRATFERRGTVLPKGPPFALTEAYQGDAKKQVQWSAFLKRSGLDDPALKFEPVIEALRAFVLDPLAALSDGSEWKGEWSPVGPWKIDGEP